jgi:adenosylcobinamide-GDP ribazoletransferase
MEAALRATVASVAFLTRIPVGRRLDLDVRDVGRGAVLFPLVGGLVSGAAGLACDLLTGPLPALVAGGVAVAIAALLTGAMHLDALADSADALGASTRAEALEIMRDHAVGTYGTVALVLVCLVDAAALGSLGSIEKAAVVGLAAGAAGRAAMLPLGRLLPYARPGAGQGRVLEHLGPVGLVLGMLVAVVLAVPAGWAGLAGLGAAAAVALLLGLYYRYWLGGVTGDLLGAAAKLGETAALLTALVVLT